MVDAPAWIYPEFFQAAREYFLYLQQLSVLLLTAIAIIFYQNKKAGGIGFYIVATITFLFGIGCLIAGLILYSSYLDAILDFSTKPSFEKIRCWIMVQFILAIITTIFVAVSACLSKLGK